MEIAGLVLRSTGKWYQVKGEDGKEYTCQIKGKLRMKGVRSTNPVAVGDHVQFEVKEDDEDSGVIISIDKRKNYIIRKSVNLSKESHIVASNLDQAFLLVTLKTPTTSTGFIDRFLVTAEAYEIPVIIVFHKSDIYNDEDMDKLEELKNNYEKIGYECIITSAETNHNVNLVYLKMKDKVNMFSGHSGAGKSTLINVMNPGINIKTAEVSDSHNKGKHTTTFAEMHELNIGGYIIDTPGIKGFGLVDIPKEDLHHYFPEIFARLPKCKFHNCLHINEPKCAVKTAVENGEIAASRYRNYLMMYNDDDTASYRPLGY